MRPPARIFQTFSLLIGAMALVLSSAGLVGASPVDGEETPGNSASAVPEHAAEKQGGPDDVDVDVDADADNTSASNDSTTDGGEDGGEAEDSLHPSGKDRLVEPGNSGTQGNAPSDPDDDGNGPDRSNLGADKPGGEGGVFKVDQDGNNGCGNDQDFEDDNEGLCLGPDGAPGQQQDDTDEGDDIDEDNDSDVGDGDEDNNAGGADKVAICHATGSETNPYNLITVSVSSILNPAGHGDHEDDIIPPFEGFDGQGDLDLIDAACEVDDGAEAPDDGDGDGDGNGDGNGDNGDENVDGDNGNEGVDNGNVGVDNDEDDVLGEVIVNVPTRNVRPATPATPMVTPATPASPAVEMVADRNTQVLGSQVTRSSQLPRTGDETTNLVPFGLGLVLLGFGLQRTSKRFSAARAS